MPRGSTYGIFTYIYHKNEPNVGEYTSPMDPMGCIDPLHLHYIYDIKKSTANIGSDQPPLRLQGRSNPKRKSLRKTPVANAGV